MAGNTMRVVGLDFETYYDKEYNLKKCTTEAYIRDPRFEIIGVSIKIDERCTPHWFSGTHEEVLAFLDSYINWKEDAVLCHNSAFDGAILSWVLDRRPKLLLDTMSMARPMHLKTTGVSLETLATYYGVGTKGTAVHNACGMRRLAFTKEQLDTYGAYCSNDVDITYKLFKILAKKTNSLELQVIDRTIRMFTQPTLKLNTDKLEEYLTSIQDNKTKLLQEAKADDRKEFMSADMFAGLLRAEGVEPPTKWSEKQNKKVYAFAKTDKEMKALLDHDSARVQALVACRLGLKTTIEETRTKRLIDISKRGLFPVMLNYWGAGTGRFSGGDKVNPQNFRRGGKIREALEPIDGHVIIASDLSQIEARILALVAGQNDLVNTFASAGDPYCDFATDVYGRPIIKSKDKEERFLGKTCILGLGYYTGAVKLRETLRQGPNKDGVGGLIVSIEEAQRIVKLYRNKYNKIPEFWRDCGRALDHMVMGGSGYISKTFNIQYHNNEVHLPNGAVLYYPKLERHKNKDTGETELRYLNRREWTKIYSGLLCENIIQALARGVIVEYIVAISNTLGVALQVHDEIVCVVPEGDSTQAVLHIEKVMSTAPAWLPTLPVACEVKVGANYGAAK